MAARKDLAHAGTHPDATLQPTVASRGCTGRRSEVAPRSIATVRLWATTVTKPGTPKGGRAFLGNRPGRVRVRLSGCQSPVRKLCPARSCWRGFASLQSTQLDSARRPLPRPAEWRDRSPPDTGQWSA